MEDGLISKTRRKREMHALQDLGEALVGLNGERLACLDLPEPLREAVEEARRVKGFEARRRQLQYIGRLMRDVDPAPIQARITAWESGSRIQTAWLHDLERWRERLLVDPDALTELAQTCPGADLQHLRNLVRNARLEAEAQKTPRHYRALFHALRDLMPQPEFDETDHP
jgi:ribosome-associated protein